MDKNIVALLLACWAALNSIFIIVLLVGVIKEWINTNIHEKVQDEGAIITNAIQDTLKEREEKEIQAFRRIGKDYAELRHTVMHFHPEAFGRGREASEPEEEADSGQPEAYTRNSVGF